jgi:hypothetical protein
MLAKIVCNITKKLKAYNYKYKYKRWAVFLKETMEDEICPNTQLSYTQVQAQAGCIET